MIPKLITFYYSGWFVALLVVLFFLHRVLQTEGGSSPVQVVSAEFRKFQRNYALVYLIMMGADWLQGPYVYALYKHYGFTIGEIGQLFILGFATSMVFGCLVGTVADKYGRRSMCLAFGVLYSLSCLTKHSSSFGMLMLGRFLGGISTSILFSSFEAWMVHEHHEAQYPEEWLGSTFSLCTWGNGIVAITAGVIASFVRDSFGPVAPFDVALCALVCGTAIVASTWKENTGDSRLELSGALQHAWKRLMQDPKIPLLGLTQSFFEGAMYVFVFMWTPALESTSEFPIAHGWIFASFMICTLMGSHIFKTLLERNYQAERIALYMFMVAAAALATPALLPVHSIRLVSFFVFEVCCGIFWPCLGFLRSRYVPEEVRATVMNMFRMPLNLIVVLVLYNIASLSEASVFLVCGACLLPAIVCQWRLVQMTSVDTQSGSIEEVPVPAADPKDLGI